MLRADQSYYSSSRGEHECNQIPWDILLKSIIVNLMVELQKSQSHHQRQLDSSSPKIRGSESDTC